MITSPGPALWQCGEGRPLIHRRVVTVTTSGVVSVTTCVDLRESASGCWAVLYGGLGAAAGRVAAVTAKGGPVAAKTSKTGVASGEFPRAESDRAYAWEHLAHLTDPDNYELEGDLREVAAALDRLMTDAYTSQLREITVTDALAALLVIRKVRDILALGEGYLIEAAREKGATWERLAPALEVRTRQAAERRATSLRQPMTADHSSARKRIEANRDTAVEARAERRFAMSNAHEIQQVAEQIAALPDLQAAADAAGELEHAQHRRVPGLRSSSTALPAIDRPLWPHRLRAELAKQGGGDPSELLDVLRQIPRSERIERRDLAVLAEAARALRHRQHEAVMDVMRRRWNRRDGLPEDHVDED